MMLEETIPHINNLMSEYYGEKVKPHKNTNKIETGSAWTWDERWDSGQNMADCDCGSQRRWAGLYHFLYYSSEFSISGSDNSSIARHKNGENTGRRVHFSSKDSRI